jgi:hypothetical protein
MLTRATHRPRYQFQQCDVGAPKKYSAAAEYFFSADFRLAEFIFRRIFGGTKFGGGGGQIRRLRGLW